MYAFSAVERDRYGFIVKQQSPSEYKDPSKKAKRGWEHYMKSISHDFNQIQRNDQVTQLILREGIPSEIRGRVRLFSSLQISHVSYSSVSTGLVWISSSPKTKRKHYVLR
jgi:hypothetical protein